MSTCSACGCRPAKAAAERVPHEDGPLDAEVLQGGVELVGERHVGDRRSPERQQGTDLGLGRDLTALDCAGQEQRGEGLGERADLVLGVFVRAEVGVGDGGAFDDGDAGAAERAAQRRPGACRERGVARHSRRE